MIEIDFKSFIVNIIFHHNKKLSSSAPLFHGGVGSTACVWHINALFILTLSGVRSFSNQTYMYRSSQANQCIQAKWYSSIIDIWNFQLAFCISKNRLVHSSFSNVGYNSCKMECYISLKLMNIKASLKYRRGWRRFRLLLFGIF